MIRNMFNVATQIRENAIKSPEKEAVIWDMGGANYKHMTYREFEAETDAYAYGLAEAGIGKGVKTILLIKPDIRMFLILTALMKTGAVPILIDAGMGVGNMMRRLASIEADAFIGISIAQALRSLKRKQFTSIKTRVTVGRKIFGGGYSMSDIHRPHAEPFPIDNPGPDELATIFFTTGSTGPAKGVEITSGMWTAQMEQMRKFIEPGEEIIDLATFPIFVFNDIVLGNTAVLPEMDPTKPAKVDPERIIKTIEDQKITNIFGSPALLDRVGRYAQPRGILFPNITRVVTGGAPVSISIMKTFSQLLVDAEVLSIYGATECLPICHIGSNEVLSETNMPEHLTRGTCMGLPVPGVELKIIKISDEPVEEYSDELLAGDGRVGEIMIRGDHVSTRYHKRPDADCDHKVREGTKIWHRMGDLGWIDDQGRVWFCGRKTHRVETGENTLFTVPCENVFNSDPRVKRSALVGINKGNGVEPVICIEPESGAQTNELLAEELLELAGTCEITAPVRQVEFFDAFPVDIRHNAKIFREQLAEECSKRKRLVKTL
ncbi:MAG: AMP-binding protein [Actinobacteria bacterium]|nr:AMP-binding protein [Actinomycetota bacterium]